MYTYFCLIFIMVSAKCAAPPSGRSVRHGDIRSQYLLVLEKLHLPSRSTLVNTMYPNPQRLIASAVFSGSWISSGGGVREVFTEQNRQPRVHVSPMSYKAVSDGCNALAYTHHDGRRGLSLRCLISRCNAVRSSTPAFTYVRASRLFAHSV
jgi:hypothetical protein